MAENKLYSIVSKINLLPEFLRSRALSTFFGNVVKFAGTSNVVVEELTNQRAVISIKNKKAVQNHIGSVHAVANILIAESATGYLVGMNVPDSCVPVIKTIKADYVKRAKGDMRAVAVLTDAQVAQMRTEEKGETSVKVEITDAEGKEPVVMEMIWAWTPKRR
ncbi:MAG: DUF4442 domain-containing protein [Hahellaceae bacterium]|nr:DUF4442 domain-containing protein [Hahellaceae bacterium]MCP5169278.1 DUF4442 domain-containing protein [Hahellaceae bacterium]